MIEVSTWKENEIGECSTPHKCEKNAKKRIPTFPSGFSFWELKYHECFKFLGKGFKNQTFFLIEPSIDYWKGIYKINIKNECTFFIQGFETQVMVGIFF
jgi:hypothetical protein